MYFVYLIACEFKNDILLKIGKTRCIQNRLKAIQTNCPHKISNIFIITSEYEEDIIGLEKLVHKLLFNHSCKLNGEWYLGTKEFF